MRETPRPQETAGGSRAAHPQPRSGRALAHTTGASGSGTPHRSDGRPPHTPRGARHTGQGGRPGTSPPVPGRPAFLFPAFAALAALFSLLTWQVVADGPLRRLDERVGGHLAGRGPQDVAQALADLGSMPVALPVLALALGYAVWRGARLDALIAAVTMALVPALVVPLKIWTDRAGPLTSDTGYYPSGHTATAMVAYGGAALLLAPYTAPRRAWVMPAAAGVLTAATGIGLVLHGYHWPLDVLASGCLCGLLLLLSSTGMRRSSSRTPRRRTGPS
ncbi:phosphatase PAP2 family protein [Streptomyces sp. NBC_00648]|uniref:phosphatase PAP2 family protein n=1 Tax=Streptomyces sp. NBC_00648 TaxID=2975797 RepID=UPI00324A0981